MRQLLIVVLAIVALVDGEYGIVGARPANGLERREEIIWRRRDVKAEVEEPSVGTAAVEGAVEPVLEAVPAEEPAGESAETPLPAVKGGTTLAEDGDSVESPGTAKSLDTGDSDTPEQISDDAVAEELVPADTPEATPKPNADTASSDVLEETTEPTGPGDGPTPAETANLKDGANVTVNKTIPKDVTADTETHDQSAKVPAVVSDAPYNTPVASPVNDPVVPSKGKVTSDLADGAQVPTAEADTTSPAATSPKEAQQSPEPSYNAVPVGETSAAEGEYAPSPFQLIMLTRD